MPMAKKKRPRASVQPNLARSIRRKQAEILQHQRAIARLTKELEEARGVLAGDSGASEQGARSRPIRESSSVGWALKVLRTIGKPLPIDALIQGVHQMSGESVSKPTLVSSLARYDRAGDTFTRPRASVYGLVEFEQTEAHDDAGGNDSVDLH